MKLSGPKSCGAAHAVPGAPRLDLTFEAPQLIAGVRPSQRMSVRDQCSELEKTRMPSLVSIKTVLRCRDFEASRRFYHSVLHLRILEEWNERLGQGAIFGF